MPSFNYNYYPSPLIPHGTFVVLLAVALAICAAGVALFVLRITEGSPLVAMIAVICVVAGSIAVSGAWFYQKNAQSFTTPVFAPKTMLESLWVNYTISYIDSPSGRTFDTQRNNDTTSEGEGYTMLRAVWMDDEATFDKSWNWTATNLQRSDHLFSWLYGPTGNGTDGVIVAQNGENSASDADTDIALALAFAYARWQNQAYLQAAIPVIKSIWANEVFTANGKPYLAPNNLTSAERSGRYQLVNPSYFAPYAYRIFAELDQEDNWNGLIDTSYQVLDNSIALPLDKTTSADLPPDWLILDTQTGGLSAPAAADANADADTNFGYDAIRVPFRIALDWEWYADPRDKDALEKLHFLTDQWNKQQIIDPVYAHDGTPVPPLYQAPATYGGVMGYFLVADPANAQAVYDEKLQSLYDPDSETWKLPLSYYDSNIAWFGIALYNHALPNLFTALNALPGNVSSTPTSSSP